MTFRVVIDGANLCKPTDALPWKIDFLESAIRDVSTAARSADPKRNLELKVYIDASTYYKFQTLADQHRFDELCQDGAIERTPAGGGADPYILKWAVDHQAIVVSNDQYKEFQDKHTWIKDSGRSLSAVYDASLRKWNFVERFSGKNTPRELTEILNDQKALVALSTGKAKVDQTSTQSATAPTSSTPAEAAPPPSPAPSLSKVNSSAPIFGAYAKPIKRDAPGAIVLLVDQSGSMGSVWDGGGTKSVGVAESINNLLESLVLASIRNRGDVYPYFDVAVIGYGGSGKNAIRSLLPKTTIADPIRSIDKISRQAKVESSTRNGIAEERSVWITPHHDGQTPMCEALITATQILKPWVEKNMNSFPPIVMNVTDGVSTDGAPQLPARDLLSLKTNDGSVLLLNINIGGPSDGSALGGAAGTPAPAPLPKKPSGSSTVTMRRILFPNDSIPLPNEAARTLFDMSSVIPEPLRKRAEDLEISLLVGARGFCYNATAADLTRFFDIGTPQNTQ